MGHSDIRLTMDFYASLIEEDRDDHGSRLSDAAEEAFATKCTQNVRTLLKTSQKRGAASEIRTPDLRITSVFGPCIESQTMSDS